MNISKLGGLMGARIEGIDFNQGLSDAVIDEIAETLFEHQVVCIAAEQMSTEQHAQIARRFGELEHNATDQFGVMKTCPI